MHPFEEILPSLQPRLEAGEKVIDRLECHKGFFDGYLVLTSQRLLFCEYTPIFGLKLQSVALADIQEAAHRKLPMEEFLSIRLPLGEMKFGRFNGEQAQAFLTRVQKAIEAIRGSRPMPVEAAPVDMPEALSAQVAESRPHENLRTGMPAKVEVPTPSDQHIFGQVIPETAPVDWDGEEGTFHRKPLTHTFGTEALPPFTLERTTVLRSRTKRAVGGNLLLLFGWFFFLLPWLSHHSHIPDGVLPFVSIMLVAAVLYNLFIGKRRDIGTLRLAINGEQGIAPGQLLHVEMQAHSEVEMEMPRFSLQLVAFSRQVIQGQVRSNAGPILMVVFSQPLPAPIRRGETLFLKAEVVLPIPEIPSGQSAWELESYQLLFTRTEPAFVMDRIILPVPPVN